MKAIYNGLPYSIVGEEGDYLILEPVTFSGKAATVHLGDPELSIDPTDDEMSHAVEKATKS